LGSSPSAVFFILGDEAMNKPNYYAILTADVRYDKSITPNAKLLYAEISSLTNKEGYCWASNKYFAELYEVDTRTIRRWLSSLREKGYIYYELTQKDDGKTERKIYLANTPRTIMSSPPDKNVRTLGQECPPNNKPNSKKNSKGKFKSADEFYRYNTALFQEEMKASSKKRE
jgi:hypothetical protein